NAGFNADVDAPAIHALGKLGLARNIPVNDIHDRITDLIGVISRCEDRTVYEAACRTLSDWAVDGYIEDESLNNTIVDALIARLKEFSKINRAMVTLTLTTLINVNINEYASSITAGKKSIEAIIAIINDKTVDPLIRATAIEIMSGFIEEKKDVQREGRLKVEDVEKVVNLLKGLAETEHTVNALKDVAASDDDPLIRGKALIAIARFYRYRVDLSVVDAVRAIAAQAADKDTIAAQMTALGILSKRYMDYYLPSSPVEETLINPEDYYKYLDSADPGTREAALYLLGEVAGARTVSFAMKEEIGRKLRETLAKDSPQGMEDLIAITEIAASDEEARDEAEIPALVSAMIRASDRNTFLIYGSGQGEIERQLFKLAYLEGTETGTPEDILAAKAIYRIVAGDKKKFNSYREEAIKLIIEAIRNKDLKPGLRLALVNSLNDILTNTEIPNAMAWNVVREMAPEVWREDTPLNFRSTQVSLILNVLFCRETISLDGDVCADIADIIVHYAKDPSIDVGLEKAAARLLSSANVPGTVKTKFRADLLELAGTSDKTTAKWINRVTAIVDDDHEAYKEYGVTGGTYGTDPGPKAIPNASKGSHLAENNERLGAFAKAVTILSSIKKNELGEVELHKYRKLDHFTLMLNPTDLTGDANIKAVLDGTYDDAIRNNIDDLKDFYAPVTILLTPQITNIDLVMALIDHVQLLINKGGAAGKIKIGLYVKTGERADKLEGLAARLATLPKGEIEIYIQGMPGRKRLEKDDLLPGVIFGRTYRLFRSALGKEAVINIMFPNKSFSAEWFSSLESEFAAGGSLQGVKRFYSTSFEMTQTAEARNVFQHLLDEYGHEDRSGFIDDCKVSWNYIRYGVMHGDLNKVLKGIKELRLIFIVGIFLAIALVPIAFLNWIRSKKMTSTKLPAAGPGPGAAPAYRFPQMTDPGISISASWSQYRTYMVWGMSSFVMFLIAVTGMATLSFMNVDLPIVVTNMIRYSAVIAGTIAVVTAISAIKNSVDRRLDLMRSVNRRPDLQRAPSSVRERIARAIAQIDGVGIEAITLDGMRRRYDTERGALYDVSTSLGTRYEVELVEQEKRGYRNANNQEIAQGEFLKVARGGRVIGIYAFMEPREGPGAGWSEERQRQRDRLYANNIAEYIRTIAAAGSAVGTYIFNLEYVRDSALRANLRGLRNNCAPYQVNVVNNPAGGMQVILHVDGAGADPVIFRGHEGEAQLRNIEEAALRSDLREGKESEHLTAAVTPIPRNYEGTAGLRRWMLIAADIYNGIYFLEGDYTPRAATPFFSFGRRAVRDQAGAPALDPAGNIRYEPNLHPFMIMGIGLVGVALFVSSLWLVPYVTLTLSAVIGFLSLWHGMRAKYKPGAVYGTLLSAISLLSLGIDQATAISIVMTIAGIVSTLIAVSEARNRNQVIQFSALSKLLPVSIAGLIYAMTSSQAIFSVTIATAFAVSAFAKWRKEGIRKAIIPLFGASIAILAMPLKSTISWFIISSMAGMFGIGTGTILQPGVLLGLTAAVTIFGGLSLLLPAIVGVAMRVSSLRSRFATYLGTTVFLSGVGTLIFALVLDWSFALGYMIMPVFIGFLLTIHTPVKVFLDWLITRVSPEKLEPRNADILIRGVTSTDDNTIFLWPFNTMGLPSIEGVIPSLQECVMNNRDRLVYRIAQASIRGGNIIPITVDGMMTPEAQERTREAVLNRILNEAIEGRRSQLSDLINLAKKTTAIEINRNRPAGTEEIMPEDVTCRQVVTHYAKELGSVGVSAAIDRMDEAVISETLRQAWLQHRNDPGFFENAYFELQEAGRPSQYYRPKENRIKYGVTSGAPLWVTPGNAALAWTAVQEGREGTVGLAYLDGTPYSSRITRTLEIDNTRGDRDFVRIFWEEYFNNRDFLQTLYKVNMPGGASTYILPSDLILIELMEIQKLREQFPEIEFIYIRGAFAYGAPGIGRAGNKIVERKAGAYNDVMNLFDGRIFVNLAQNDRSKLQLPYQPSVDEEMGRNQFGMILRDGSLDRFRRIIQGAEEPSLLGFGIDESALRDLGIGVYTDGATYAATRIEDEEKEIRNIMIMDSEIAEPDCVLNLIAAASHPANDRYSIFEFSINEFNPEVSDHTRMCKAAQDALWYTVIAAQVASEQGSFFGKALVVKKRYREELANVADLRTGLIRKKASAEIVGKLNPQRLNYLRQLMNTLYTARDADRILRRYLPDMGAREQFMGELARRVGEESLDRSIREEKVDPAPHMDLALTGLVRRGILTEEDKAHILADFADLNRDHYDPNVDLEFLNLPPNSKYLSHDTFETAHAVPLIIQDVYAGEGAPISYGANLARFTRWYNGDKRAISVWTESMPTELHPMVRIKNMMNPKEIWEIGFLRLGTWILQPLFYVWLIIGCIGMLTGGLGITSVLVGAWLYIVTLTMIILIPKWGTARNWSQRSKMIWETLVTTILLSGTPIVLTHIMGRGLMGDIVNTIKGLDTVYQWTPALAEDRPQGLRESFEKTWQITKFGFSLLTFVALLAASIASNGGWWLVIALPQVLAWVMSPIPMWSTGQKLKDSIKITLVTFGSMMLGAIVGAFLTISTPFVIENQSVPFGEIAPVFKVLDMQFVQIAPLVVLGLLTCAMVVLFINDRIDRSRAEGQRHNRLLAGVISIGAGALTGFIVSAGVWMFFSLIGGALPRLPLITAAAFIITGVAVGAYGRSVLLLGKAGYLKKPVSAAWMWTGLFTAMASGINRILSIKPISLILNPVKLAAGPLKPLVMKPLGWLVMLLGGDPSKLAEKERFIIATVGFVGAVFGGIITAAALISGFAGFGAVVGAIEGGFIIAFITNRIHLRVEKRREAEKIEGMEEFYDLTLTQQKIIVEIYEAIKRDVRGIPPTGESLDYYEGMMERYGIPTDAISSILNSLARRELLDGKISEARLTQLSATIGVFYPQVQTSGIKMRKLGDMPPVNMARGNVAGIKDFINGVRSGYGDRFENVVDGLLRQYPQLRRNDLVFMLVRGNENLMSMKDGTIMIDFDIFTSVPSNYEFEHILKLELEEELAHLVDYVEHGARAPPAEVRAISEVKTDYAKVTHFLQYSPTEKAEVFKALINDNDIDDQEFFLVLAKSMTRQELAEIVGILETEYAGLASSNPVVGANIEKLRGIQHHQPSTPLSSYQLYKLVTEYARKDGVYDSAIRDYLRNLANDEIMFAIASDDPRAYLDTLEEILKAGEVTGDELKNMVERTVLSCPDENKKIAIILALPPEAISGNIAAIIARHRPSETVRREALKACVRGMEDIFEKARDGRISSWGRIVITSTKEMTPLYEEYLRSLEGVLFPKDMAVDVIDETDLDINFRCGNGGATGAVFEYLENRHGHEVFNEPILVLHAGGLGQRLPEAIAEGTKALAKVPRMLPNGEVSTNLAESIRNTYIVSQKMREAGAGGVYITNCDGFFVYDHNNITLNPDGINVFTAPVDMDRVAGKLGVAHDQADHTIDVFLEKESRGWNAEVFSDYPEYTSTGMIPANTANYYIPKSAIGGVVNLWKGLKGYRKEVDTAGEILVPLATGITKDQYVALRKKGDFSKMAYDLAQQLGKCYNTYVGTLGLYDDLGETEIFLDGKDSILAYIFDWKPVLNETVVGQSVDSRGALTDVTLSGNTKVGANSWVVNAHLHDAAVGVHSLIYDGVGTKMDGLVVGDDQSLFRAYVIGANDQVINAVSWRMISDDPKKTKIWGRSIVEMCTTAGTIHSLEEVVPEGKSVNEMTLWDAPLWPLLSDADSVEEALGWMSKGGQPSALYMRVPKVSMKWMSAHYNYNKKIEEMQKARKAGRMKKTRLNKGLIINIGGSARSGKTNVAEMLAASMGGVNFDRGSVYRALTLKALSKQIDLDNEGAVLGMIRHTDIGLRHGRLYLDGTDVTDRLRGPDVEANVAKISTRDGEIRTRLEAKIRHIIVDLANRQPVVITGRGPYRDALINIFLTVPLDEAVKRDLAAAKIEATPENIEEARRRIAERDAKDFAGLKFSDVAIMENKNSLETMVTICTILNRTFEEYLADSHKNRGGPINTHNLNTYYEPHLPLRKYSLDEICALIRQYTTELAGQIDRRDPMGRMHYDFLINRRDYLLSELRGKSNAEGLYPFLLGITGVAPYAVNQIPDDGAVDIFMARDASPYFMALDILGSLKGKKSKAFNFHLSRKNMVHSYKFMQRTVNEFAADPNMRTSKEAFERAIFESFSRNMEKNPKFRKEAADFYRQLKESGIVSDQERKYRIIDSWSAATMLFYMNSLIKFFAKYDITEEGLLVARAVPADVTVDIFRISSKENVLPVGKWTNWELVRSGIERWYTGTGIVNIEPSPLGNIMPSVNWRDSGITWEDVERWYNEGDSVAPVDRTPEGLLEFLELMGAQLFKRYNPYGTASIGHPVDWRRNEGALYEASPAKQLGHFLRSILMINSVIDFAVSRNIIDKAPEAKMPVYGEREILQASNISFFLRDFGVSLGKNELRVMTVIRNRFNEHFSTSNDSIQTVMLLNVAELIKFFGASACSDAVENYYQFQDIIHNIKDIPPMEFKIALRSLSRKTGIGWIREAFISSPIKKQNEFAKRIVREVEAVRKHRIENEEARKARGLQYPKAALELDVDGTILSMPGKQIPPLLLNQLITLMRNKIYICINTGKRSRDVEAQVLNVIRDNMGEQEYAQLSKYLYVKTHSSSVAAMADDLTAETKVVFNEEEKAAIQTVISDLRVKVLSEKDTRFLIVPTIGKTPQEACDIIREELLKKGLLVYVVLGGTG
ncbi:MAG: (d)CMP kinase, partial [Candidatus Omnitrophica bacterium]|nr:(d)CMP kinase [Candidatus Omnitrophota bacterium]